MENIKPMSDTTIILLGRYGDIVNILPLAWKRAQSGKVRWIVAEQFKDIFEGIDYVEPIPIKAEYHEGIPAAQALAKKMGLPNVIIPQPCNNPDKKRLTDSYQKEAWRLAGALDEFGCYPPTEWDNPGGQWAQWFHKTALVFTAGHSSRYEHENSLLAMLRGDGAEIVDGSHILCERPQGLIPGMQYADIIIATDSLPLHLSRSCCVPVVSIINDGWKGSVPPPQSVATFRYSDDPQMIVNKVLQIMDWKRGEVIQVTDIHGSTERHLAARATWGRGVFRSDWKRDATAIGEPRNLHYLKDLLEAALGVAHHNDCILWTNDDVQVHDRDAFAEHVKNFEFCSIRRDKDHVGREAFAFRAGWLSQHLHEMPDVILGAPWWDLVIARWMRNFRGIKTTKENLAYDFFPCEIPPGAIYHEPHESEWLQHTKTPAALHNQKLWET